MFSEADEVWYSLKIPTIFLQDELLVKNTLITTNAECRRDQYWSLARRELLSSFVCRDIKSKSSDDSSGVWQRLRVLRWSVMSRRGVDGTWGAQLTRRRAAAVRSPYVLPTGAALHHSDVVGSHLSVVAHEFDFLIAYYSVDAAVFHDLRFTPDFHELWIPCPIAFRNAVASAENFGHGFQRPTEAIGNVSLRTKSVTTDIITAAVYNNLQNSLHRWRCIFAK